MFVYYSGGILMTLSNSVFDAKHIRCVPVIAVFSSTGDIKPLYVTINWVKLKIETYTILDSTFGDNWIYFLCTVIDHGKQKQFKIQYNLHEHAWFIETKYFS